MKRSLGRPSAVPTEDVHPAPTTLIPNESPYLFHMAQEAFASLVPSDPMEASQHLREGLPLALLGKIVEATGLPQEQILRVLGISRSTLNRRRKRHERFSLQESESLDRLAVRFQEAVELFHGDPEAAQAWFHKPATALGGMSPVEACADERGGDAVGELIHNIQHGQFT